MSMEDLDHQTFGEKSTRERTAERPRLSSFAALRISGLASQILRCAQDDRRSLKMSGHFLSSKHKKTEIARKNH